MKRVFVVGCPRSGTTLLQAMLAAHPGVVSFPESHVYRTLRPRSRALRAAGFASPGAGPGLTRFLEELGRPDLVALVPERSVRAAAYVQAFVTALDRIAIEQGATAWVEKTPGHLRHLRWIERDVPDAVFVHIVRAGRDVVASLYDVAKSSPEEWGGFRDLDSCINRWLEDVEITRSRMGRPRHVPVRYERLVRDPERELRAVCESIGLPFERTMVDEHSAAVEALVAPGEVWKDGTARPVTSAESKFTTVLDRDQRERVEHRLRDVDVDTWLGPA